MPPFHIPHNLSLSVEGHKQWLKILNDAQALVDEDVQLQEKAEKGLRIRERQPPMEVVGRMYAQYCCLLNKLFDTYLNNLQIQRAEYLKDIVRVILSRIFELRNEMVHMVVNDYIYVDNALIQSRLTPDQIEIIIPYYIPLDCRSESGEQLLQKMWTEAIKRKNAPPKKVKPPKERQTPLFPSSDTNFQPEPESESESSEEDEDIVSEPPSVHTVITEEFIQANILQRHERFRQFFVTDAKAKCRTRKTYFAKDVPEAPMELRILAATLIQKIYREFMKIKRSRVRDAKRDMMLGLIPDPWREVLQFNEENNKVYERRIRTRTKLETIFLKELEKERIRLIVFKKDDQIDDITTQIREWFKEWYYGYGFFPEIPYPLEGGTIMVIRGDFPTIEEKIEEDEKYLAATKGKTKDMLKQEKKQAAIDKALKAETEKEEKRKLAEVLFKLRCNPLSDPGYEVQQSEVKTSLVEALHKYQSAWSSFDQYPLDKCADVIYGYMQPLLTEELMSEIHTECRVYVDELMRLDLKLLIKMQQLMFKRVGFKYPKMKPRKKPKALPIPKPLNINDELLKDFEPLFDMGLITKPKTRIKDVFGDSNYAAYELNLKDPDAKFPLPGYGDVRRRLVLTCAYGTGVSPGAVKRKAVLLVGPPRNGKSFLVDAVCGEINAVKIDISPEVFTAHVEKPGKLLTKAFLAAKVLQPTVIFLRNVEKVFSAKVAPEDRKLNAKRLKPLLPKAIKTISNDDQVIFIATCSDPLAAPNRTLYSLVNEVLLVPRLDYGTLQQYLYNKFQSIRSMPRDYNVYSLAKLLQGYGFGVIIELFNKIMNSERIVSLNVTPLSPFEFLEPLVEAGTEPLSVEDYQVFVEFFLGSCSLKKEREEYEFINAYRDVVYKKEAEKKSKKATKPS